MSSKIYRNVSDAKAQLSMLIEAALSGKEVILGKANKPLIRLCIYQAQNQQRKPGRLKGKIKMSADFDAWDSELSELFEGKS